MSEKREGKAGGGMVHWWVLGHSSRSNELQLSADQGEAVL